MKLSRIEPFVANPDAEAELKLVAKRIQNENQDAAPVAAANGDQGLDNSTDSGVADGFVRLSEFLQHFAKKNKGKVIEQKRRDRVIGAYLGLFSKVEELDDKGVQMHYEV